VPRFRPSRRILRLPRALRRMRRRLHPRVPLPRGAVRVLRRVNRLAETGQWAEAAEAYAALAQRAAGLGMPVRAANLWLQASRAHLKVGNVEVSTAMGKDGLRLLVENHRLARASFALRRLCEDLRGSGFGAEAIQLDEEVQDWIERARAAASVEHPSTRVSDAVSKLRELPGKCSGCGAPLIPYEVEWHGEATAECPYCGSAIKTA
jgi:hypothetical protein